MLLLKNINSSKPLHWLSTISLVLLFSSATAAWEIVPLNENFYSKIQQEYGEQTEKRFRTLQSLLLREDKRPLKEELIAVNDFFNQIQWRDDLSHWGKKDYWQTPLETMTSFTGDCEDIAIAKYTALRMLGVGDDRLALVYVKINQPPVYNDVAHMILAYYKNHDADPLIMDSIDRSLKASSQREDLLSIYEFNTTTLWLTDHHLHKLSKGFPSSSLSLENNLKQRLSKNRKHLSKLNGGKPFYPFSLETL
ncbi:MAG: transglutaminase-like cysteine peptidase [Porticoccus sp.]|nr:transglutaminase-like cysteine peptidase [Porticoccus sp.]MBQ0807979.1 transglutaminase-like cysteine peptidase [Porticoccus sp.]